MEATEKLFTQRYMLTAGECNGEQELPLWLLASRIIEAASLHANALNIGFERLKEANQSWVLSRLAIEMQRYPKAGDIYCVHTWIESFNRHFSERNFEITDGDGTVLGYARSVWMVIDSTTRESCDMSYLCSPELILTKECPIAKQSKVKAIAATETRNHRFLYSDIDFNRHVNTLRYICAILDMLPIDFYDNNLLSRFEIAFMKETYFGTEVSINFDNSVTNDFTAEITADSAPLCKSRLLFQAR